MTQRNGIRGDGMAGEDKPTRSVWDPAANGGAGGWVPRPVTDPTPPPQDQAPEPGDQPSRPAPPPRPAARPVPPPPTMRLAADQVPGAARQQPRTPPAPHTPPSTVPLAPAPPATPAAPPPTAPPPAAPPPASPAPTPLTVPLAATPPASPPPPGQPLPDDGWWTSDGAPVPYQGYQPRQLSEPGPDTPAPPEPARGRRWRTVAVAAAVVVCGVGLGFGAVRLLDDGDSSSAAPPSGQPAAPSVTPDEPSREDPPPPSPSASASELETAQDQAADVDALLDRSADDRQSVISAVQTVSACAPPSSLAAAADDLRAAADNRDDLVRQLGELDVELVEGGQEATETLSRAWTHSADADRAFAAWADTMAGGGCTGGSAPQDADYDRGTSSSVRATTAKKSFVRQWNPIAEEHGLEARSENAL